MTIRVTSEGLRAPLSFSRQLACSPATFQVCSTELPNFFFSSLQNTIARLFDFALLGAAHYLWCLGLGPKRNKLSKWFFRQPSGCVNMFLLSFKGWVAYFDSPPLVG